MIGGHVGCFLRIERPETVTQATSNMNCTLTCQAKVQESGCVGLDEESSFFGRGLLRIARVTWR